MRNNCAQHRPDKEDVKKVVSIVLRNKLLVEIGHREHRSFSKYETESRLQVGCEEI